MELVSMVVLREKAEDVMSGLLKLAVLHPVDIRHVESELSGLAPFQVEREYAEWDALSIQARELARELGVNPRPLAPGAIPPYSYAALKQKLDGLGVQAGPLVKQKELLTEELKTKEAIFRHVKEYFPIPVQRGSFYSFLDTSVGKIEEKNIEAVERNLQEVPHLLYPFNKDASGKIIVLVIGLRRDRVFVDSVLDDFSWEKIEYPRELSEFSSDAEGKLKIQLAEYRQRIAALEGQTKTLAGSSQAMLGEVYSLIHLRKTLLEAKRHSCLTEKTVVLAGWIPAEERERVAAAVRSIDPTFYLENRKPEEVTVPKDEIPVRLRHSRWLQPFELLVDAYGLVRYGSVDPTLFVAVSFLAMFGVMFGDIGQGLVLVLAGLLLHRAAKAGAQRAAVILSCCGASSVVFGALYGSCFGIEYPSLWIKPMTNVMELFRVSIFFGIGFMSLGIVFNIVNAFRDKDYSKAFFDKAGLIAAVIYWVAIGAVTKFLVTKAPAGAGALVILAAGLVLLLLRPAFELLFHKRKENIFMLFMENTVEVLEICVGYLSNTVSFMRIAAYAITHFSLFLAVFELSRSLKGAGFIVIILGNIMIILLEGLVAGIQAIRLNYYEFFAKFFMTGKYVFKPLTAEIKD